MRRNFMFSCLRAYARMMLLSSRRGWKKDTRVEHVSYMLNYARLRRGAAAASLSITQKIEGQA